MSVIWKDGQFLDGLKTHISHEDSGLANGLGVFDTMLAENSVLINAYEHFERLVHDAQYVLGFDRSWLPLFSAFSEAWIPLLAENKLSKGYARIKTIVTGGTSSAPLNVSAIPCVIITATKTPDPSTLPAMSCAVITDFPRIARAKIENCKRLDYTRSFAARRAAKARGADEAILTNTDGNIACAATSNIFIVKNGIWVTPPLTDGVLSGITRANIIEQKQAKVESISLSNLEEADEVYLTNSLSGLRKVSVIL
jgi:branched-subunit amino acid aminotransferase/4-amino-4-deoxychorismate lyase